jgi:hypothetical protein
MEDNNIVIIIVIYCNYIYTSSSSCYLKILKIKKAAADKAADDKAFKEAADDKRSF